MTFEGEYYQTRDLTLYDKPEVPVPIFVAAGGQVAAKFAGRSGDGFICTSGKGLELYTDTLLPAVREGADWAEGCRLRHIAWWHGVNPGTVHKIINNKQWIEP